MTHVKRLVLAMLGVALLSILLSTLTTAGTDQLKNDNDQIYAASRFGRLQGDIDGAVFHPDPDLFPITIQSVEFVFHLPQERPAPWIGDSAQVRVQIYAMEDGVPGDVIAESEMEFFSAVDQWLSIPLPDPLTLEEPANFMAALKWESGSDSERALPLALDGNLSAPQTEKDAKNLYHRVDLHMPVTCQTGFCTHSELGLVDEQDQSMGFNMIRVTIDSPRIPTPTPVVLTPTATPTVTPSPTPASSDNRRVYLPAVMRNHQPGVAALRIGNGAGEAVSYALTSGNGLASQCWPGGDSNNLWVGREPADERGIMRSVLRFDLSDVPADAVVVEAVLQLWVVEAEADGAASMPVFIREVTREWSGCPTWVALGDASGQVWARFDAGSGVAVSTVDVTALARAWLNHELPNYGLMLHGDEERVGQFRGFVPTASSQEDLRPSLLIKYR